jgi:hypothetical protein
MALQQRPPFGTARVDDEGRDLHELATPQELPELDEAMHPQEHRIFFGALDPKRLTLTERALRNLHAGSNSFPRVTSVNERTSNAGPRKSQRNCRTPLRCRRPTSSLHEGVFTALSLARVRVFMALLMLPWVVERA